MWSPLLVVTLPGHHGTFGLRIKRALVRMNKNETRNAPSRMNPSRCDVVSRKCPLALVLSVRAGITPTSKACAADCCKAVQLDADKPPGTPGARRSSSPVALVFLDGPLGRR